MKIDLNDKTTPGSPIGDHVNPDADPANTTRAESAPHDKENDNRPPPPPPAPINTDEDAPGNEAESQAETKSAAESESTWKYLGDLKKDPPDSQTELIKHRFLCVSAGLLVIGPSGIGKSSLIIQLTTAFALGRASLGFTPVRPLKTLIIQAENDETDLADMRDGVFEGLMLTDQEKQEAGKQIVVVTEDTLRGNDLCLKRIEPLLQEHTPDLLIIDPAFAYIDGDSISARDVGLFLRTQLNPLVRKYQCGLILVHHTNKPGRESNSNKPGFDYSYLGSGSADFTNWARAVVVLQKVEDQVFDLWAAKRGFRLNWKSSSGEGIIVKRIAHCKTPGRIWWEELTEQEVADQEAATKQEAARKRAAKKTGASPKGAAPGREELLALVPETGQISKTILLLEAEKKNIKPHRSRSIIAALVHADIIREVDKPREGKKPQVMIERVPPADNAA